MVRMVRGPATVRVIGNCRVLGADVSLGFVEVKAGKVLAFEPDNDCTLEVEGESWLVDAKGAGTLMWQAIAANILSVCERSICTFTVMVVGATDTGKSTFSTYLANMALARGIVTCIIDGDIGQGDLAPPGALGAAILKEQVTDLRNVKADIFAFVGTITPTGAESLIAQKLRFLASRMSARMKTIMTMMMMTSSAAQRTTTVTAAHPSASLKIVNTDGYMEPSYKHMLAKAVSPNVIVCMRQTDNPHNAVGAGNSDENENENENEDYSDDDDDEGNNYDDLASKLSGPWKLVIAPSSTQAVKTRSERVERRLEQYSRYIGTGLVTKARGSVQFLHRDRPVRWHLMLGLRPQGMFVALGSRGRIDGFGTIESMDSQNVSVRTDVSDFTTIHAGEILLRAGREERLI
jgi:polynucleotide 5'-kinase involved in rRNA processing